MLRKGDLLKLAWFDLLQKKKQNKRTWFLVFCTGNYSIKLGYCIKVQCMCVHVYKYTSVYIHAHMSHMPTPHSLEYACTHTASCERSLQYPDGKSFLWHAQLADAWVNTLSHPNTWPPPWRLVWCVPHPAIPRRMLALTGQSRAGEPTPKSVAGCSAELTPSNLQV